MSGNKWDLRFLELAKHISGWSKDPSTKVGTVIVNDSRVIISTGYNGFPKGIRDNPEDYADREKKLSRIIHAEMNAILNAPFSVRDCTLYTTLLTCERCAVHVVQAGIKRVVAPKPPPELEARWSDSFKAAIDIFELAGVEIELIDTGNIC